MIRYRLSPLNDSRTLSLSILERSPSFRFSNVSLSILERFLRFSNDSRFRSIYTVPLLPPLPSGRLRLLIPRGRHLRWQPHFAAARHGTLSPQLTLFPPARHHALARATHPPRPRTSCLPKLSAHSPSAPTIDPVTCRQAGILTTTSRRTTRFAPPRPFFQPFSPHSPVLALARARNSPFPRLALKTRPSHHHACSSCPAKILLVFPLHCHFSLPTCFALLACTRARQRSKLTPPPHPHWNYLRADFRRAAPPRAAMPALLRATSPPPSPARSPSASPP